MDRRHALLSLAALPLAPTIARADDRETLRFAWWGGAGRHQATLKALQLFEQLNPGVRVKAEYMGFNGYLERLTTQIAGDSEADLMQINWAWLAMFSKRGNGFADLNRYADALRLNQFEPADIATGMVAGKLNALSVSFSARVFLWNEAAFQRRGVPIPKTWEELFAAGPKFKRQGEQFYPLDGELYDMLLLAQSYIQQAYGTPFVDPHEPRVAMSPKVLVEWVRTYRRLVDEHVCTPLPLRASLGGAEKPTEQQQDWVVGNWAGNYTRDSVIGLRASTMDPQQKIALGDWLELPGAKESGMFGRPTLMFCIGRNAQQSGKAELAAKLMAFLTTDPRAVPILGRSRGLPAARGQIEQLQKLGQVPPIELAAREQIAQARRAGRVITPSPLFEHARLARFMREVFETVAYGKATPEEAAQRLFKEGNGLLRRIK
jgi:oligogalacturonide transport system substrate-binding protein